MALRFLSPIHRAYLQIAIYVEERCSDLDLNTSEGHTLSYLRSYSPAPVSELHRALGIKRSTLTSVLDRLESRGWLGRQPSRRDRRVILVGLTDAGRVEADRVQETVERLEADIGARLGPGDLEGFRTVISTIAAVTEKGRPLGGGRPST
jgi:DNA-binding MarR family transcriptional regulator